MQVHSLSGFLKSNTGKWIITFILLTIIALASTIQSAIVMLQKHQYEIAYSNNLFFHLFYWWFWLAVIPLIIHLSKKFDFSKNRVTSSIFVHLILMIIIVLIHQAYTSAWCNFLFGKLLYMPLLDKIVWRILNLEWIFVDFAVYSLFVVAFFALEYQKKSNEREKIILQLETRLAQAQLQALRMQLHPHFLFNTMNAISTLILKGEIQKANKMLVMFSEFLRMTLEETGSQEVPLEKELLFIESYLEVEKVRFQDKLNFDLNIHPSTNTIMVPNLILQPLVENAIKYAIGPKTSGGEINITSSINNNKLILQVRDNGPGIKDNEAMKSGSGIGIKNTCERLEKLYGDEAFIHFKNPETGGLLITIEIPIAEFGINDNNNDLVEENILPVYQL